MNVELGQNACNPFCPYLTKWPDGMSQDEALRTLFETHCQLLFVHRP